MSDESKKIEKNQPEASPSELTERDLEQVAGGAGTTNADKLKATHKSSQDAVTKWKDTGGM